MKDTLIVLTGGSGSGKSFYENFLSKNGFEKFISHTTREARIKDNEKHGVDYFFVSKEDFDKIEMLELTKVKDNYYGVSMEEYLSKKGNSVVVVDPNGAKQIVDKLGISNLVLVLLDISEEERVQNMINRGDTKEFIDFRLNNENFVKDYYNLGLEPNILIKERLEDPNVLLNQINSILNQRNELMKVYSYNYIEL